MVRYRGTITGLEQYHLIGSSNAKYRLSAFQTTEESSYSIRMQGHNLTTNTRTVNHWRWYVIPNIDVSIGSLNLYVTSLKITLADVDSNNYVRYIRIYNDAGTQIGSNLWDLSGDTSTLTEREIACTKTQITGEGGFYISVECLCSVGTGNLDISNPKIKLHLE